MRGLTTMLIVAGVLAGGAFGQAENAGSPENSAAPQQSAGAGESAARVSLQDGAGLASRSQRDFAKANTQWWTFGGGVMSDFDGVSDVSVHGAFSTFVDDGVEVAFDLALRGFVQDGDDALGINPSIVFRWHFWRSDEEATWTAFADVGIGVMGSTSDVPQDGTSFNFTPRAAIGLTRRLDDTLRLQTGLRWSHISNARIEGDDDNPASDGVQLFVALIVPF